MRHLHLFFFFSFFFLILQKGIAEDIHEDWVKADSIFIKQIVDIKKANPRLINQYLRIVERDRVNLGFGYSLIEGRYGIGYVSIVYSIVYRYQRMLSYKLTPEMPSDSRLIKRYLKFYSGGFKIVRSEPM